jgi:hypothetical protein
LIIRLEYKGKNKELFYLLAHAGSKSDLLTSASCQEKGEPHTRNLGILQPQVLII